MKTLEISVKLKDVKPLTSKQKEQVMTVFGTVFIIVLTVTSAFSLDERNDNILTTLNEQSQETLKG